jgi:hypothetical protein
MHTMTSRREGLLSGVLSERGTLVELLVVAVLLAVGINLVSSALPELLRWLTLTTGVVGCVLILVALLLLVTKIYRQLDYTRTIKGFFVLDKNANELVDVPRYDYAHDLRRFLRGAFAEDSALRAVWDRDPLTKAYEFDRESGQMNYHVTDAGRLIREATEYYVLSSLSTHLTDYFNDDTFDDGELQTFLRQDVPDVLLTNRFMDLFTRAMDQRAPFVDHPSAVGKMSVVAAYGREGALYDRFDLVLPKNAKVSRIGEDKVNVHTKRLSVTLTVKFDHGADVLPHDFARRYLRLVDYDGFDVCSRNSCAGHVPLWCVAYPKRLALLPMDRLVSNQTKRRHGSQ